MFKTRRLASAGSRPKLLKAGLIVAVLAAPLSIAPAAPAAAT